MKANISESDWELLERWLDDPTFISWARQNNAQCLSKWEEYFNLHPSYWDLAKVGRSLVLGVSFPPIQVNEVNSRKALASLLDRAEQIKKQDSNRLSHFSVKKQLRRWIAAASVAIIFLCAGTYWKYFHNPLVVLETEYGQQIESQLPDGSTVTINANSVLRYYRLSPRKVNLVGEAFFEIRPDLENHQPFQVLTNDLSITVLGTEFNVNTRNDQTEVFLAEGKVTLDVTGADNQKIDMTPGDMISYSKSEKKIEKSHGESSTLEAASWTEGALIFKDTPLKKALFEIEDIYGIQFIVETEVLKEDPITGGVPIKNLEVTLSTLMEVYGIKIKKVGHRYFVSGRK